MLVGFTCRKCFESTDDLRDAVARLSIVAQYYDSMHDYDSMHVIGHDNERIEFNTAIMIGQIGPGLVHNSADIIQAYIGFNDITE